MSDQGPGGDNTTADAIAKQARVRQGRDKELVESSREGDRNAFGKLYDSWVDHVYDRAVNGGASAAEARAVTEQTFLTVWHNLGRLRQPAAIGAKILQVAQRQATTHVKAPGAGAAISGKPGEAEDRLTRTTDAVHAAADPDVAAVLRDASLALDDRTRTVLDLHFRQGLTASEVGAVVGMDADGVKETIAKLPTALGVLTRARVLWRGGQPLDEELTAVLEEEHITSFDAATVRTINKFAKDHDRARARSMIAVAPIELYAAIPLAAAPAGLKMAVAESLVTEGVPMDGSAFVKRDDHGEILAKPKEKRADLNAPVAAAARPAPPLAPSVDKKKAAAVAAAALAAEAVALADEAEGATTIVEPAEVAPKSKVSERFRARKSPAPIAAAAAGASVLESTEAGPASLVPVDHSSNGSNGSNGSGASAGSGDGTSDPRGDATAAGPMLPAPPVASLPVIGASGLADPPSAPTADDLDARAQGEAAAMGRAYRPNSSDDGGARVIPGSAHLDSDDGPNRKKMLVIGGAAAAAVLLLGGAAFAMRGSGDDTKTAGGGPRPTNPAQEQGAGAATTTLPATTTTAVVVTTQPAPTTTLAPAPEGGGDSVTSVAPDTGAGGGGGGGGGGAPSGGGGGNPSPNPVTPTTAAPVTANVVQSASGSFGFDTIETNRPMTYPMSGAPVLAWNLTSTGPFTATLSWTDDAGNLRSITGGSAGTVPLCPGIADTTANTCTVAHPGTYSFTLTLNSSGEAPRNFGTRFFNIT